MVEKSDWLSDDKPEEEEESKETASSAPASDLTAETLSTLTAEDEEQRSITPVAETLPSTQQQHTPSKQPSDETNSNSNTKNSDIVFEEGDHIYSWCSFWGFPYAYAHHGIVIERDASAGKVTILDFSCLVNETETSRKLRGIASIRSRASNSNSSAGTSSVSIGSENDNDTDTDEHPASNSSISVASSFTSDNNTTTNSNNTSILKSYTIDDAEATKSWRKVKYDAHFLEPLVRRAGTVSRRSSDPTERILARVDFLLGNLHLLSKYDLFRSNCEHVAVWCKTGHFCSLQLLSLMGRTFALSTAPTLAVSTATTTVPAAGLWGWFGYTTTVSLASVVPWLVPLAVVPPAISAGRSFYNTKRWRQTTELLNARFGEWKLEPHEYPAPSWSSEKIFAEEEVVRAEVVGVVEEDVIKV